MSMQQPQRVGNFNAATRENLLTLPALTPPTAGVAGQISRIDLPQTGFLAGIYLLLQGRTDTAGGGSTTLLGYPFPPLNFLRRIRVHNNQGFQLWNTSGYGAYLYNGTLRTGIDQVTAHADLVYGAPAGTVTAQYFQPTAALGATANDIWRCAYYLPIAWGPGLQHGLQLLQDSAIRYTLEVTWGDLTDLYSATVNATLSQISVTPLVHIFSVPEEAVDFPSLAYTKGVEEDAQPLTTLAGVNTYRCPTGNVVTKIIHDLSEIVGGVRQPIAPANVTQIALQYSQVQVPYVVNADLALFRQRWLYGRNLPQGVYAFELASPLMLPELPGVRDVINTARLTDLQTQITIAGAAGTVPELRTIREQLFANR